MNSLKSFLNGLNSKSVNNKSLLLLLLFLFGLLLKFYICLFVTEVDLMEVFSFVPSCGCFSDLVWFLGFNFGVTTRPALMDN